MKFLLNRKLLVNMKMKIHNVLHNGHLRNRNNCPLYRGGAGTRDEPLRTSTWEAIERSQGERKLNRFFA